MDIRLTKRIENANYDKVLYYLDKMLSESDRYCRCHRCRQDAAALALNTLPPHYYVVTGGAKVEDLGSPWILIEIAVREALEKVSMFPHHPSLKESAEPLGDLLAEEGGAVA